MLGPVLEGLRRVKSDGIAEHLGFTGLGDTAPLMRVVDAEGFETVQSYFNALNPSAGWAGAVPPGGQDFDGLIDRAAARGDGVIVIRPLAAGAVAASPSRHAYAGNPGTALVAGAQYADDLHRAEGLAYLATELGLEGPVELGLRFALSKPGVSTVIVGFSDLAQLDDALRWADRGPVAKETIERILGQVTGP